MSVSVKILFTGIFLAIVISGCHSARVWVPEEPAEETDGNIKDEYSEVANVFARPSDKVVQEEEVVSDLPVPWKSVTDEWKLMNPDAIDVAKRKAAKAKAAVRKSSDSGSDENSDEEQDEEVPVPDSDDADAGEQEDAEEQDTGDESPEEDQPEPGFGHGDPPSFEREQEHDDASEEDSDEKEDEEKKSDEVDLTLEDIPPVIKEAIQKEIARAKNRKKYENQVKVDTKKRNKKNKDDDPPPPEVIEPHDDFDEEVAKEESAELAAMPPIVREAIKKELEQRLKQKGDDGDLADDFGDKRYTGDGPLDGGKKGKGKKGKKGWKACRKALKKGKKGKGKGKGKNGFGWCGPPRRPPPPHPPHKKWHPKDGLLEQWTKGSQWHRIIQYYHWWKDQKDHEHKLHGHHNPHHKGGPFHEHAPGVVDSLFKGSFWERAYRTYIDWRKDYRPSAPKETINFDNY